MSSPKIREMIDLFTNHVLEGEVGSVEANDTFLGQLMALAPKPVYQGKQKTEDGKETPLTAAELAELKECDAIVRNTFLKAEPLWTRSEELYELATKWPPVLLESLLPVAMVVYLLRTKVRGFEVDFNPESDNFDVFFNGWQHVVIDAPARS